MAKYTAAVLSKAIRTAAARDPAGPNDRELLRRFAAGEQAAFAALFRRHAGMVLGVCRRALPTVQDAEDACQATFLVLARRAGAGRWQSSVANWLYLTARRVAHNARIAARRRARRKRRAAVPESVPPVDRMTGRELLEALDEELGRLPPGYREPLVLCYLEGLTRDEAAARLDLPPATVKIRLERGRKHLGDALTRRGCAAGAGLLTLAATAAGGAVPPHLAGGALAAASGQAPAAVVALARGAAGSAMVSRSVAALLVLAVTAALGFALASADRPQPATGQAPAAEQPKGPAPAGAMPAPGARAADKAAPPAARSAPRVVSGRVVGPDGKPAAGAKLFVPAFPATFPKSLDDVGIRPAGTADADGHFAVTVPPPPAWAEVPRTHVIAYAPGFGVDWLQFGGDAGPEPSGEQALRLTKDVPITGRVVNTEGRPVPGVKVTVMAVYVPADEKLDDYLAGWKRELRNNLASPRKRLYAPLDGVTGPTTTDRDGRFTVRGAGAERIVHLLIEGGGVARSIPYVITRPGFDPKPYNDELLKKEHEQLRVLNRFLGLFAPDFTFVAQAGKEMTGVVTDADTGAPVEGCRVSTHTGFGDGVLDTTDARGRYRLAGLPANGKEFLVSVGPPAGSAYLARNEGVADSEALAPVRADFRLARGAVVTGRVVDRQTGKGLRAGVRFAPLPNNKVFGTRPEYNLYARDRTMSGTDKDGRFRQITIPGPALVMVQVQEGETYNGDYLSPYRRAVPDPDHKDLFQKEDDSWVVRTAGSGLEFLMTEHAAKVIDVKATGETGVELFVERGVTGKVTVQDADGRPLAGAWVAGLTDHWPITYRLTEPTATVYALDPETPRTLAVYHPEKRSGGTVKVRGDEKEPAVARLGPMARMTGRLLDTDGLPLAGMAVSLNPAREIERDLYQKARPDGEPARTDKDGRFAIGGVLPGVPVYLQFRKGEVNYAGKPRVGQRTVKPNETLDLGDRVLEPLR